METMRSSEKGDSKDESPKAGYYRKCSKFESVFLGLAAALPDSVKDNVSKLLKRLLSDFKKTRDAASKQLHDAANSQSAVNAGGISEFLDYCEKHSDLGIMNDVISLMLRKCHEEYLKSWRRCVSSFYYFMLQGTHEQENSKGCNKEYECENDSNTATTSYVASETKDESCSSEDEGLEAGCSGWDNDAAPATHLAVHPKPTKGGRSHVDDVAPAAAHVNHRPTLGGRAAHDDDDVPGALPAHLVNYMPTMKGKFPTVPPVVVAAAALVNSKPSKGGRAPHGGDDDDHHNLASSSAAVLVSTRHAKAWGGSFCSCCTCSSPC
ncbi:hypothetical protein CEUSTIGMA_g2334.t1 [Chlamydomonas eustigma]|uniref:Uncharacterized protein n=1 Tax=Chlamydomonas eustigma TaxID=1157962 RepID=A0A250WVN7_9CHLO|nr:hypothetical protein CEUSTIGMA_g2334.t1 [Chlamydomonas eustigma]|eukprot:GAX74888.1 hypothetical protein CEUSTIGMA_g2334.t1 [Chlamydomonas eustigma]